MATAQLEDQASQPQTPVDEVTAPGQPRDMTDVQSDQGILSPSHENSSGRAMSSEQRNSATARRTNAAFAQTVSKQKVPKLRPAAGKCPAMRNTSLTSLQEPGLWLTVCHPAGS